MGLGNYFRPSSTSKEPKDNQPKDKQTPSRATRTPRAPKTQLIGEPSIYLRNHIRSHSLPATPSRGRVRSRDVIHSRRPLRPQSFSGRSSRSAGSSSVLNGIKHEVMVNYLYQQQCARLWVSDGNGDSEGVILRKTRTQYLACPPQLAYTPFARAMASLGVQVSHTNTHNTHTKPPLTGKETS